MKKLILAAAQALFGSVAVAADRIEGIWQTAKDANGNYGHIEVKTCGPAIWPVWRCSCQG